MILKIHSTSSNDVIQRGVLCVFSSFLPHLDLDLERELVAVIRYRVGEYLDNDVITNGDDVVNIARARARRGVSCDHPRDLVPNSE